MLSAGALIWISCRPLIRLLITTGSGIIITKLDLFPSVAARGAGQILLNITLPCLLFSRIVPAFSSENVSALGPLILVACLYEAIGIVFAWLIKQFFWVPHRFRYGILVAGGWGNVGDIPVAVVMSVTSAAPFNGPKDQNLSVAYISAFILVFVVTLFPMGGSNWISKDYVGPDVEPQEVQEQLRKRRKRIMQTFCFQSKLSESSDSESDASVQPVGPLVTGPDLEKGDSERPPLDSEKRQPSVQFIAIDSATNTLVPGAGSAASPACSPPPTEFRGTHLDTLEKVDTPLTVEPRKNPPCEPQTNNAPATPQRILSFLSKTVKTRLIPALRSLLSPPSLSIVLSFPIAVIPVLKALFVFVPASASNPDKPLLPFAPDGQPPLAFILDTATFIGGASVPLGLISLGSALARLRMPSWKSVFSISRPRPRSRPRSRSHSSLSRPSEVDSGSVEGGSSTSEHDQLPTGAIVSLAVVKMILMPILGVCICQGLTRAGIIDENDRVLRFVCIFCSCLPTATTQVFLTQVFSGTGTAEHLSLFIMPQYFIMSFSMTAIIAYSIQLLF